MPAVHVGDHAPDFTGHDIVNNTTFHLHDYLGKVVLLTFVYRG